jgi:hypothetical protein
MKKILWPILAVITIALLSFTDLQTLILQPNTDTANLFSAYDADRNELFGINSVTDIISIGSGVAVNGGSFTSSTLSAPTINTPSIDTPTLTGIVTGSSSLRGSNAFTTTAAVDTVLITGLLATDFVFVTGEYKAGVDQQDVLQAEIKADTLIVHRLAAGESGALYNYLIVR